MGVSRSIVWMAGVAVLELSGLASAAAAPALDARDLALLRSATWGISGSAASEMQAAGRTRWLEAQIRTGPPSPLPSGVEQEIRSLPGAGKSLQTLVTELDSQGRAASAIEDPESRKAAQQAQQASLNDIARAGAARAILQALYSPDQLREKASWFWLNHFSVHQGKANLRAMVGDYLDSAIRPHALGRFRDLLAATLRHPAMLRYLDNVDNAAGHLNENYARELLELHTMGVGSGYTQSDVEALARILTGVGIDPRPDDPKLKPELRAQLVRDGLFEFNPARHDYGDKVFLDHEIKGSGFAEVEAALDILARHPATATHISGKLATYFVGDHPPARLVQLMSDTFRRTDGDISAVVRTMFTASEFEAAAAGHVKDPTGYVLSAVRLAYGDKVILNTAPIQNWLNRLAEGWFNHVAPDGYPLGPAAWTGPGQMTTRFEIARQIGSGSAGLFKPQGEDLGEQPAFPLLQNALYFTSLRARLAPATLRALDQAVSPQDWNTLFLASPDFMR